MGTDYTGYPGSGTAAPPPDFSNIQSILANPSLVAQLQAGGVDPYAFADQQASAQSDLAYAQHIQEVLSGINFGGGGGSNPILDDLARQGITNDQSYLDVLSQLAQKKVGLTGQTYKAQLAQLTNAGIDNNFAKQLLGIQGSNTKLDMARLGLKQQDVTDAITKLNLGLENLGFQREGAANTEATQERNIRSDATARGALGSAGTGASLSDNEKQYQLALKDIGNREAGVRTDIGTTQRQFSAIDLDRQQVQNALKGLGIQTDQLNLKDSDIALAKQLLGLQNQGDQMQQYGDMAQLNNQQEALRLKGLGIGVSSGAGGGDAAGTLAALQAGAQANSLANNLNSLTGSFGRQALGALGNYYSQQSFGSAAGPLGSLSSPLNSPSSLTTPPSTSGGGNYWNPLLGRVPSFGYSGSLPPYGNSQTGTGGMSTLGGGGKLY